MHVTSILPVGMVALVVLMAGANEDAPSPGATRLQPRVFEKQITIRFDYLIYLPKDYVQDKEKKWPLILFLHGAGERGTDVNRVKIHGPAKLIDKGKDFPFIIVAPQCPPNTWWDTPSLIALLDDIQKQHRVDADRVYLTGLSMGGFGTWELAMRYPERFAAIAPICGGGNPLRINTLRDMPIWVFHGDADPVVALQKSQEMVDALKRIGSDVKFTVYPGVGHDSWTATYENPKLFEWFLSHKRGDKKPQTRPAR